MVAGVFFRERAACAKSSPSPDRAPIEIFDFPVPIDFGEPVVEEGCFVFRTFTCEALLGKDVPCSGGCVTGIQEFDDGTFRMVGICASGQTEAQEVTPKLTVKVGDVPPPELLKDVPRPHGSFGRQRIADVKCGDKYLCHCPLGSDVIIPKCVKTARQDILFKQYVSPDEHPTPCNVEGVESEQPLPDLLLNTER